MASKPGIDIPEDIILHEILLRQPVNCLLKFRSVCKAWRDLIGSRSFTDFHLKHPSQNTRTNYLVLKFKSSETQYGSTALSFYSRGDGGSLRAIPLDFPDLPRHVTQIGGPCNGIFLAGKHFRNFPICLCNPATRECWKLPQRPFVKDSKLQSLGFGFDPGSNDFKVVALMSWGTILEVFKHQIFNVSSNLWREADDGIFPVIDINGVFTLDLNRSTNEKYILDGCGLFFNGYLHWRIGIRVNNGWWMWIILCFNISNETMRYFTIPTHLCSNGKCAMALLMFEGSLALAVTSRRDENGNSLTMLNMPACSLEVG